MFTLCFLLIALMVLDIACCCLLFLIKGCDFLTVQCTIGRYLSLELHSVFLIQARTCGHEPGRVKA